MQHQPTSPGSGHASGGEPPLTHAAHGPDRVPHSHLGVRERLRLTEPPEDVFDALADLFLGDGALGAQVVARSGAGEDAARGSDGVVTPRGAESGGRTSWADDELPAVIGSIGTAAEPTDERRAERARLGSPASAPTKPERPGDHAATDRASAPGGSPAPAERGSRAEADRSRTPVECVVLGHLPVMAAAWVGQYARHRSIELGGPVGLVRVWRDEGDATMVSVDVIDETRDSSDVGPEESRDVHATIARLADGVRLWIVRASEFDEPALAGRRDVDLVTLLSGADEAAMVASYRALKRLSPRAEAGAAAPEAESDMHGTGGGRLGVALMGADSERARSAIERLERVAASFLGETVRSAACGKIAARGPARHACRGECAGGVDELLAIVRAASDHAASRATTDERSGDDGSSLAMVEAFADGRSTGLDGAGRASGFVEPPASLGRDTPADRGPIAIARGWIEDTGAVARPLDQGGAPRRGEVAGVPAGRDAGAKRSERAATPAATPAAALDGERGWRAASLLGFSPIEARCPYAPAIELAIDNRRMLHLIACEGDAPDRAGVGRLGEAGERDATRCVRELVEAAAWAGAHAGLLGLSLGHSLASGEAVLHLVTREPRRVRRMLDAPVKVHALVECGGERVAVELN